MAHDSSTTSFLVRHATAADAAAVRALARLDDRRPPCAPFLIAEAAGEPVAALSLVDHALVADPFRHTRAAAELLRLRAAQLAEDHGSPRHLPPALRPATAG